MLKNRIITALVLAPLVILAVLFLPVQWFAVLWGVIILGAAWEWADLAGLSAPPARIGYAVIVLAWILLARITAEHWAPSILPEWFYWPVVAWWFLCGMVMRRIPEKLPNINYPPALKLGLGVFVLVTSWILMVWLRVNFSNFQVLYLLLLIWVADAAAYFVGKRWGNTKLSEAISPGKTVEGAYGALFAAALLAVGTGFLFDFKAVTITDFVFLSLLTVVISIVGDLFESLAKRVRGVKDSGALLPGHGGILDRVDSLMAAVAVFYAGSMMLNIFLDTPAPIIMNDGAPQEMSPVEGVTLPHEDDADTGAEPEQGEDGTGFESMPADGAHTPSQQEH